MTNEQTKNQIEENFNTFWKDIVTNEDGTINIEQVKKELYDYSQYIHETSIVYDTITPDIYEDTDLITLSEAKALWNKHKTQFISQLQDDNSSPEMVVWINCKNNTDYATELYYADNDTKTDGKNLWNETVTRKELL